MSLNDSSLDNIIERNYNKENTEKGGQYGREGNQDAGVLERTEVSTSSRSENHNREYSKNTKSLQRILGVSDEELRQGNFRAGQSEWLENYKGELGYGDYNEKQRMRRFLQSFCRELSRKPLKEHDTAGRRLPPEVIENFKGTVFKEK